MTCARFLVTVGLLVAVLPTSAAAQRGRTELNDGNRLYEEGRFPEAHEKYLEALRDAPDLPTALFNDGNALYESEEYVRALDAYLGAIGSGDPALEALSPPQKHLLRMGPANARLVQSKIREIQAALGR